MTKFKEVSWDRYDEMLGAVPPACGSSLGFLVGEAENHRKCHVLNLILPTYMAFVQQGDTPLEALEPMTIPEFRALAVVDIEIERRAAGPVELLKAMQHAAYEQPIGAWFGAISECLKNAE